LLGVRSPLDASAIGDEPLAGAARSFVEDFVSRGPVALELDKRRIDEEGCFLAYLEVGGQTLNVELVRSGLALEDARPGDSATMSRLLRKAEEEARWAGRGIWSGREPPHQMAQ
jgi:endonuclease YncB( thermonuclease family)